MSGKITEAFTKLWSNFIDFLPQKKTELLFNTHKALQTLSNWFSESPADSFRACCMAGGSSSWASVYPLCRVEFRFSSTYCFTNIIFKKKSVGVLWEFVKWHFELFSNFDLKSMDFLKNSNLKKQLRTPTKLRKKPRFWLKIKRTLDELSQNSPVESLVEAPWEFGSEFSFFAGLVRTGKLCLEWVRRVRW